MDGAHDFQESGTTFVLFSPRDIQLGLGESARGGMIVLSSANVMSERWFQVLISQSISGIAHLVPKNVTEEKRDSRSDEAGVKREKCMRVLCSSVVTSVTLVTLVTLSSSTMYDVRQFRPVLYLLLILGFSGFALAAQSPGLWASFPSRRWRVQLVAHPARLVPAVAAHHGQSRHAGRALLYIVSQRALGLAPILIIGQFLVLLQLVKLYEQRANRDYAQLLVLSLLLVVAASINTASLLFGVMLIAYLFLSLYCCLLFHLKIESDHAKAAIAIAETNRLNPCIALRHAISGIPR